MPSVAVSHRVFVVRTRMCLSQERSKGAPRPKLDDVRDRAVQMQRGRSRDSKQGSHSKLKLLVLYPPPCANLAACQCYSRMTTHQRFKMLSANTRTGKKDGWDTEKAET